MYHSVLFAAVAEIIYLSFLTYLLRVSIANIPEMRINNSAIYLN